MSDYFQTHERPAETIIPPDNDVHTGVPMNWHPQVITLGKTVVAEMAGLTEAWAAAFPAEPTLAHVHFGVPSLYTRADFGLTPRPDGSFDIALYEIDDHPTGAGTYQRVDPAGKDAFDRMRSQLGPRPLTRSFLPDPRPYAHDDNLWLPERNPDGSVEIDGKFHKQSAVVARGRRHAEGFGEFMDAHGQDSILPGRERDNKISLVAMNVAQLLANGQAFANMITANEAREHHLHPERKAADVARDQRHWVVKGLYSSRGEDVVAYGDKHVQGSGTLGKIVRSFQDPVIVQRLMPPQTMAKLGLEFTAGDHGLYQTIPEREGKPPRPDKFQPGKEDTYYTIFRIFSVFDAEVEQYVPTGGFWAARPNIVVHGASDAVFGKVVLDGAQQ